MFKRLIFAVFVTGLVLTLSGTAISGIGQKEGLNPVPTVNPDAALYSADRVSGAPEQSSYKIPGPPGEMLAGSGDLTPPSGYYCDIMSDWCDTTTYVYLWTLGGEPAFAHRFTVEGLDVCTVMVGWVRMLTLSGYMTGTPGLTIYLYDDDGFGFPGAILDSVHFDHDPGWGSNTFTWFGADFVTDGNNNGGNYWVFGNGDEFHIGARITGDIVGGDYIPPISDQAQPWPPHSGQERSTVSDDGGATWVTMLTSSGEDVQWFIEAEFCGFETPFSDCYEQSWVENAYWIYGTPHADYSFSEWAERFSVDGPETLIGVDVGVYDGSGFGIPDYVAGNDDLIITVYGDAGGFPDQGNILAQETVPGGTYPFYPSYTYVDLSSHNLVMTSDFHVSFGTSAVFGTGDFEFLVGDDGTTTVNRGTVLDDPGFIDPGNFVTMMDMYGENDNFHIIAHLCIDPYSECNTVSYNTGEDYFWYLPDTYGSTAQAQRIKTVGEECRIYDVSFYLYDNGDPDAYTTNSTVSVYSNGLGVPGTELASIELTPADYVLYPGKTTVDFGPLEVFVAGDYWVAIESQAADEAYGIRTLSDFGGGGFDNSYAELWSGTWGLMVNNWVGLPTDIAMAAEASHCCIPPDEWICQPVHDWYTSQYDDARTGHSDVMMGDPAANLNYTWDYEHPTAQAFFTDPVVYDGRVVLAFENQFVMFDIETGAVLNTFVPPFNPGQVRVTPLVREIGGTTYMFVGGGTNNGIYAFDFYSGTLIWAFDLANGAPLTGSTRYCTFQTAEFGGTPVLFYGTDDGNVGAIDITTGTLWGGWAVNPISVNYPVNQSGAFDGANLYYATEAAGFDCDVWSIQANTGAVRWTLATGDGLQADAIYPTAAVAGEVFRSGVSLDVNRSVLYANSYVSDGDHPADGVFYALNTSDGTIKFAVPSARSMYTTPVVDQNNVYMGFFSRWVSPPIGGNLAAFNTNNGQVNWIFSHPNDDNYYADLALSCEHEVDYANPVPDILVAGGHKGFLSFIDTEEGEELFNRQINWGNPFNSMWNGIAIVPGDGVDYDYHVVAAMFWGGVTVLSKDVAKVDRPRLELQSFNPAVPVEFGLATSWPTTIPALITNTGGAPLTINDITTDDACFTYHPEYSSVRPDVADNAMKIADVLTNDVMVKAPQINDPLDELISVRSFRGERVMNSGAMARPAFIQTATDPDGILFPPDGYIVNVGDTIDVTVDINQSLINRGPQYFSMHINTDDPDFYLNQVAMAGVDPCVWVTVVGGCLIDTTYLAFGMGCANTQTVFNTGRIATGDSWADPWGFDIDGFDQEVFQGSFIYATSQYEVALNTQAWHGGGEAEVYISMQPDPNWYDDECKAPLVEDQPVSCAGGYTEDGYTYTPITGSFVAKSFIDSVQNFDDGTGWDWMWFDAPFDNALTMGLYVNTRTIGVCDFEPLKDLTLEIFEITERNGDDVLDWKFGATMDYDVGGDLTGWDGDISTVWNYGAGSDASWGMIKVPFGCGMLPSGAGYTTNFDPAKNARTLFGYGAWWNDIYLDSAYTFMSMPPGNTSQDPGLGGDEEAHFTLVEHDFAGNETFTFAIAQFGKHGLADPTDPAEYAATANLVNKWAGFGRGDVNNDGVVDLRDLVYLKNYVYGFGPGPIPFMHLGDVNVDGAVDQADIIYLFDWYFNGGDCPMGDWCF